jgi:hypothetical protein
VPPHYATPQTRYITLRYTTLLYTTTTLHHTYLHYTTPLLLLYTTYHSIILHITQLHNTTTSHHCTLHRTTPQYTALKVTVNYSTLHYKFLTDMFILSKFLNLVKLSFSIPVPILHYIRLYYSKLHHTTIHYSTSF